MADDTAARTSPPPKWKRKIAMREKVKLARLLCIRDNGEPHNIPCTYCGKPGTVTLWPPHTYKARRDWDFRARRYVFRTVPYPVVTTSHEYDHIIPFSRGGLSTATNLTYACTVCNCSKADRSLEEWEAWLDTPRGRRSKVWANRQRWAA